MNRLALIVPLLALTSALALAQKNRVTMTFAPQEKTPAFEVTG